MKKALLVTRVSGFIPQHEMNNVKILQQMGYEVHYATNLNVVVYGKDNRRLEGTGIITHQVDFGRNPFSKDVKVAYDQLKQIMLEGEYELIHCHMPMSGVLARYTAQKVYRKMERKVPVIYTAHGFHFCKGSPLQNWIYYPLERYLARFTDRLIVMNEEDYKRAKKFPVRGSVEYVPGVGQRLERYEKIPTPGTTQREACRKEKTYIRELLGELAEDVLQENTRVLVSIGELSERKNHRILLPMLKELQDLDIIVVIGGTGVQMEYLQTEIKKLNLEKRVFLPGYIYDVNKLLAEADAYVFPSLREGLPVAVMEAMAAGLPIVASKIRGVTDLIEHGKGGYLVNGFDPTDYATKVRRLFDEERAKSAMPRQERRVQMGLWNLEQVKKFSLPVVDQRMREIYASVVNLEK